MLKRAALILVSVSLLPSLSRAHASVFASSARLATRQSPDDLFGDAACVAKSVGATKAVAFDLTAACSGFLFGVNTASQFLHNGAYKTAVVIGADALSRWVDWEDRNTCVLFGDGAGAVVLRASEEGEPSGVLGYEMHSDGSGRCNLGLGYSGVKRELGSITTVTGGAYEPIGMVGKEVYKFATTRVVSAHQARTTLPSQRWPRTSAVAAKPMPPGRPAVPLASWPMPHPRRSSRAPRVSLRSQRCSRRHLRTRSLRPTTLTGCCFTR